MTSWELFSSFPLHIYKTCSGWKNWTNSTFLFNGISKAENLAIFQPLQFINGPSPFPDILNHFHSNCTYICSPGPSFYPHPTFSPGLSCFTLSFLSPICMTPMLYLLPSLAPPSPIWFFPLHCISFFTHHASCTLQVQPPGPWQRPSQTSWSFCWVNWWKRETCSTRWGAWEKLGRCKLSKMVQNGGMWFLCQDMRLLVSLQEESGL